MRKWPPKSWDVFNAGDERSIAAIRGKGVNQGEYEITHKGQVIDPNNEYVMEDLQNNMEGFVSKAEMMDLMAQYLENGMDPQEAMRNVQAYAKKKYDEKKHKNKDAYRTGPKFSS